MKYPHEKILKEIDEFVQAKCRELDALEIPPTRRGDSAPIVLEHRIHIELRRFDRALVAYVERRRKCSE